MIVSSHLVGVILARAAHPGHRISFRTIRSTAAPTDRGRAQAPELLHWAADLLAELRILDEIGQSQLLRVVTGHIRRLQQQGQIPVVKMCLTCRFFDGYAHPGAADPHHCRLVDAAFGHQQLRLRCPEQEPVAGPPQVQ